MHGVMFIGFFRLRGRGKSAETVAAQNGGMDGGQNGQGEAAGKGAEGGGPHFAGLWDLEGV